MVPHGGPRLRRRRTADMKRREFLLAAAATPFALPQLAAGATARHGLVLVTADLAAHIVVVDGATGRVRRRIATREAPRAIERVGRAGAIVAHTTEGVVSLVDGADRRVDKVLRRLPAPALRRGASAPGVRVRDRLRRRRGGRDRPAPPGRRAAGRRRRRRRATSPSRPAARGCGRRSARRPRTSPCSTPARRTAPACCAGCGRRSSPTTSRIAANSARSGSPRATAGASRIYA